MKVNFPFEFITFLSFVYVVLFFEMFAFVSLVGFAIEDEAFCSCTSRSSFASEDVSFILFGQDELNIAFIRDVFCCAFAFIMFFLCWEFGGMGSLAGFNAIFN
jgi:hypothetical protein